MNSNTISELQ